MKAGKPLNRTALRSHPLPLVVGGDKETKGRILILAGSRDVPGAALLTATAAMRAGAGKLKIVTVESVAAHIAIAMPEAMVVGLTEHRGGGFARSAVTLIADEADDADAIVAGPGMAPGNICKQIARRARVRRRAAPQPVAGREGRARQPALAAAPRRRTRRVARLRGAGDRRGSDRLRPTLRRPLSLDRAGQGRHQPRRPPRWAGLDL